MLVCDCKNKFLKFVYKPHGHVHTGGLDLIENISLRNIMKMGAKFRETPPYNKHKLTHLYQDAIEKLTNKIDCFAKSKSNIFFSWKDSITRNIEKTLKCLPNTLKSSHMLDKPEVCKYINFLHDRFVIVPVDKASNNFVIVCKKYLDVIKNELGISNDGKISGNRFTSQYIRKLRIYTNSMSRNFWIHLVWSYSTITNIYLYSAGFKTTEILI